MTAFLSSAAPARWAALALGVTLLVLPDCCLNGSHANGAAMTAYGPICRALR